MSRRSKGASPYKKYGKREYVYSVGYQNWARQYRPTKDSQAGR